MVETEFLLEPLMRLLINPPGLSVSATILTWSLPASSTVSISLPARPTLPDEPDLLARHAPHAIVEHPVLVAIRDADTANREETCQPTSAATAPADRPPRLVPQHRRQRSVSG